MSNKTIAQLPEINPEDVPPQHTHREVVRALARAVHFARESEKTTYPIKGEQVLVLELMYSLARNMED